MKKLVLPIIVTTFLGLSVPQVKAAVFYWDPEGTTTPSAANKTGTWDTTTAQWSTASTLSSSLVAWNTANAACFAAAAASPGMTYTVTVNQNITMGGIFNGSLGPGGDFVTISGSGSFVIPTGVTAAFSTGGSDGGTTTLNIPISGGGIVNPQSSKQIFFNVANSYTGGTIINASALVNFNSPTAFSSGTITLAGAGGALIANTSGMTVANNWTTTLAQGANAFNLSASLSPCTTTYSGNWNLPVNVSIGAGGGGLNTNTVILTGIISGAGGITKTLQTGNGSLLVLKGVNTYTGPTTNLWDTLQIDGSGSLGSGTYAGNIVNSGSNIIFSTSANQTLSGVISGAGKLIYNGPGNLTLTGVNTYTGATTIGSGLTLQVGNGGTGALAATPIANNGTLAINSTSSFTLGGVISGTGGITKAGSGTLTLNQINTYTGKTVVNGGTLTINTASSDATLGAAPGSFVADQLQLNNGVTLNEGSSANMTLVTNRGVTVTGSVNISTSKNLEIQGIISGTGSITKSGASAQSLELSGSNTFTGGLTIAAARVDFNNNQAAGFGPITVAPTANVILAATNSAHAIVITNDITANNNGFQIDIVAINNGSELDLNGIISGSATLVRGKNGGAGNVVLNGANTFTGGFTNVEGPLVLGNASALGTGLFMIAPNSQAPSGLIPFISANTDLSGANAIANAVLLTNGTAGAGFIVNGANNLEFSGPITLGASPAITNNNTAKTIFSGGISESAGAVGSGLTVAGSGTLVVGGTSSYTGPTTVVSGNLQVDGDISTSSGLTVNGGTLKGNGTVPATTVNTGASVNPGASPGTLSVIGSLSFNAGSTNIVEFNDFAGTAGSNPGWDLINCGSLAINGAIKLKINSLNGTVSGAAANFNNTTDYSGMLILHATNGISAGDTTLITIDQSDFNANNNAGGTVFSVSAVTNNDNSVDLFLSTAVAPVVTVAPTSSGSVGNTVTISATVTGDPTITYQWKKGANNLTENATVPGGTATATGVTSTTLVLAGVSYQDDDSYTLVANNSAGTASGTSVLHVSDPPVITSPTSPSIVVKDAGQNLTLSVTTTGRPVATFQWKKGGNNLSNGAFDNAATVSGSQTSALVLTSVRAADAADYTVSVANVDGSQLSVATTLQVNDPVITQQPVDSAFECGTSNALTVTAVGTTNANGVLLYQWYLGDTNSSTQLTDQTNAFLPFATTSFANAGSYFVIVTNGLNNSITSAVVTVTVQDTTGPVITVTGAPQTLQCHQDTYTELGATATDGCDGSVAVNTTGTVDTTMPGTYTITYTATDSHTNTSTANLVITVQDTIAPSLTLLGSPESTISCGTPYTDAGVTASDLCAGNIIGLVVTNYGGFTPAAPVGGDYTITYNVNDPSGNPASPVSRIIHVIDNTPPVVNLIGGAEVTNECHTAFADPGVTAMDLCSGNVSNSVYFVGNLDTNTIGVYTITYFADDGAGNTNSSVTRIVHVEDHTPPNVVLNSGSMVTNECHVAWVDPGASANDDCALDLTSQIVVDLGGLDTNSPALGTYTVTYTATDPSTNSGFTTRIVVISDTQPPQITVLGNNPATAECHTAYSDAGATATDLCAGDLTSQIQVDFGGLDTNSPALGTYTVSYVVSDPNGNSATNTRTVIVGDATPPSLALQGAGEVTTGCGMPYTDAGATASDLCAGDISGSIVVDMGGLVASAPTLGDYTITYNVSDPNSNPATPITRIVHVTDTAPPVVSLVGSNVTVECHTAFVDPGYSANDACEGPVLVNVTGNLDTNTVGTYTLTYTACDSGSHCASVTRVVQVVDQTAPQITVTGDNPATTCLHSVYVDAGATANDTCAGPVAAPWTDGTVDTNTVGTYTITYTAVDPSNNTNTATRVVNVIDCGIVITTQPTNQLHQPQGTNVTLLVATAPNVLTPSYTYQWYEENVAIAGATDTSYSFSAHTNAASLHFTNVHYFVVISNSQMATVTSSNALVTVIVDNKAPTVILTSPKAGFRTNSDQFTIMGTAKDSAGGDTIAILYQYTNHTLHSASLVYSNYIYDGTGSTARAFSFIGQPMDPGTNDLEVWSVDLAGHVSTHPTVVKGLFSRVPITYHLTVAGDGGGVITATTKASKETVTGLPLPDTLCTSNITLYEYQVYTFTFAPDTAVKTAPILSVVSNAPSSTAVSGSTLVANSDSTHKIKYTFTAGTSDMSSTVYFNRNRFVDMAGNYNAVFTADTNIPNAGISRYMHLTVSKSRTLSGYLLNAAKVKDTFPTKQTFDSSGHISFTTIGGVTIDGTLAWAGSLDTNGIKQFIGSATIGGSNAMLVADQENKSAFPTDGFATMSIPGVNNNPGGSGFALLKVIKGSVTGNYTLADNDKQAVSWVLPGSRSGTVPQWIVTKTGVLFGNLTASDGLSNVTASSMNWIRNAPAAPYPYLSLLPDGFVNAQFAATCSPYTNTSASIFDGTYTVALNDGGLATNASESITITGGKYASTNGPVTAAQVIQSTGEIKVSFLDGLPSKHKTTALGAVLLNTSNAAGFYIRGTTTVPTNSGSMTLTHQ